MQALLRLCSVENFKHKKYKSLCFEQKNTLGDDILLKARCVKNYCYKKFYNLLKKLTDKLVKTYSSQYLSC